jgi:hypothetical protein
VDAAVSPTNHLGFGMDTTVVTAHVCEKWWKRNAALVIVVKSVTALRSRDTVVSIATGYGLDDGRVRFRVPLGSRIFSSPRCRDRLWGPLSLLYSGYRSLFPGCKAAGP